MVRLLSFSQKFALRANFLRKRMGSSALPEANRAVYPGKCRIWNRPRKSYRLMERHLCTVHGSSKRKMGPAQTAAVYGQKLEKKDAAFSYRARATAPPINSTGPGRARLSGVWHGPDDNLYRNAPYAGSLQSSLENAA
jgi:hypothetical protein